MYNSVHLPVKSETSLTKKPANISQMVGSTDTNEANRRFVDVIGDHVLNALNSDGMPQQHHQANQVLIIMVILLILILIYNNANTIRNYGSSTRTTEVFVYSAAGS